MSETILTHAAVARRVAEEYNKRHCTRFLPNEGLSGLCGLASHLLFNLLHENDIACRFIFAKSGGYGSHCWVKVDDLNVDVTATQFGPCSPIFTFQGEPSAHPILKNWTKDHRLYYPEGWTIDSLRSNAAINDALETWPRPERYFRGVRKTVDNILLTLFPAESIM